MKLVNRIRLFIGKLILSHKVHYMKRERHFLGFNDIKTIGIIWDASKINDFACLSKFVQKMQSRNIDVKIIGFYPDKKLPVQYTAIRYFTCLKKQDVDLFYRPISEDANLFIYQYFDILIDINFNMIFPLLYISSLSRAGLKVGPAGSSPESSPFDLMIKSDIINTENYLNQIVFYLEMINSDSEKIIV